MSEWVVGEAEKCAAWPRPPNYWADEGADQATALQSDMREQSESMSEWTLPVKPVIIVEHHQHLHHRE